MGEESVTTHKRQLKETEKGRGKGPGQVGKRVEYKEKEGGGVGNTKGGKEEQSGRDSGMRSM